jgi:hypothetical protein
VQQHGNKKWAMVADFLNQKFGSDHRSAKHCRERYVLIKYGVHILILIVDTDGTITWIPRLPKNNGQTLKK